MAADPNAHSTGVGDHTGACTRRAEYAARKRQTSLWSGLPRGVGDGSVLRVLDTIVLPIVLPHEQSERRGGGLDGKFAHVSTVVQDRARTCTVAEEVWESSHSSGW